MASGRGRFRIGDQRPLGNPADVPGCRAGGNAGRKRRAARTSAEDFAVDGIARLERNDMLLAFGFQQKIGLGFEWPDDPMNR